MSGNQPGLSASQLLPTTSGNATGSLKNKVALKPGHSLMDWVRLGHSGKDLAGTGGRQVQVTPQELAKHNKRSDCWMALKGNVYNVTPYMEFHPGGEEELMRGVGTDATDLFNEVHKWVNYETMLQKCLVGQLVQARPQFLKPAFLPLGKSLKALSSSKKSDGSLTAPSAPRSTLRVGGLGGSSAVAPVIPTPSALPSPKYDWFQTSSLVNVAVYTKWKHITRDHVVVIKRDSVLKVVSYIQDMVYVVHLSFSRAVTNDFDLKISSNSGKVDVLLGKKEEGQRWSGVGRSLEDHGTHVRLKDRQAEYVTCSLASREEVTHDTRLLVLQVPPHTHLPVPTGFHVFLRIPGTGESKPYTPVAPSLTLAQQHDEAGKKIYLFIKIYPEGTLTPALEALSVGSSVEVSLPEGSFTHDKLQRATEASGELVLLAAGTGITPMHRLLLQALHNNRKVHLILFNKTEEDIPWSGELQNLKDESSFLKVTHVLSRPSESWTGLTGHIRKELLEKLLPLGSKSHNVYVCICGPSVFTRLAQGLLKEQGYSSEEVHAFQG